MSEMIFVNLPVRDLAAARGSRVMSSYQMKSP